MSDSNSFSLPRIPDFGEMIVRVPPKQNLSHADTQFEIIKKHIIGFQESLDKDHDIGLLLTSFGSSFLMEISHVGYEHPVLMVFRGLVNGREATLIQHISQINFLLTSIPKEPEKPKRKIGFSANQEEQ